MELLQPQVRIKTIPDRNYWSGILFINFLLDYLFSSSNVEVCWKEDCYNRIAVHMDLQTKQVNISNIILIDGEFTLMILYIYWKECVFIIASFYMYCFWEDPINFSSKIPDSSNYIWNLTIYVYIWMEKWISHIFIIIFRLTNTSFRINQRKRES